MEPLGVCQGSIQTTSAWRPFTYDYLNRITSAQSQATSGADCWGQSIPSTGYDRYGNLLTINSTQCSSPALSLSVSTKNRVTNTGFTYDNGGNETFDGLYSYTWDGESHLKSANGVNYTYDGDLLRVEKSNGKLYWYSTGGQVLEETDLSGNLLNDYIWVGGMRFARRDASGNVYYYLTDGLGTTRGMLLNSNTTLCYDADFYPFGGEKVFTNTCAQNYKFTGLERDAESGLDDTLYRKYSSNLGRWLSPDPSRGRTGNPQSLNRYGYVGNNPTTFVDPLGLVKDDPCNDPSYAVGHPECGGPNPGANPPPDPSGGGIVFVPPLPIGGGGGCGGGGGGGGFASGGGGGGPAPCDPTTDPSCVGPLGRNVGDNPPPNPCPVRWDCYRQWKTPRFSGICGYFCHQEGFQFNVAEALYGTAKLKRACGHTITQCPYFLVVCTPTPGAPDPGNIVKCQQEPN